ncbi:MAG TPA: O-methyltransferase [Solirubrobacteraceae bacterium]|jgi:predicted O-methyltransferase YrrM|nr:O-methyltransferase [Solirubrobacteraceae bacterium]
MSQERWDAVDEFVESRLIDEDEALAAALADSARAGLPPIALTPAQAKLLHLIARVHGARSILELGTLGGYSTIWLARALPADGRLVTLELNPDYARVAAANVERAGLAGLIEIKVAPAIESLRELVAEGAGPFDLIFIDADKEGTPAYFEHALELSRPGSVIVTDNVVRDGAIADADGDDPRARAMRAFHELLAADRAGARRVSATTIQTVGAKGYDGFTLALVER